VTAVKFYVDSWDPSYGPALDALEGGPTAPSTAQVDVDIEVPAASWRPLSPPGGTRPPSVVRLVDGVRRIDTRVWVEESTGILLPGLAASYAAGVARCDLRRGLAEVVRAEVRRGLFTPSTDATDLGSGITGYGVQRVAGSDPTQLSAAVQPHLQALETEVSTTSREEDDLLVIDGPLRDRNHAPRALGYVKTHHRQYLPADLAATVGRLAAGQRSPVFLLGTNWNRYTWYLKLPGGMSSPWAGVVRVEASADLTRRAVVDLADLSAVTLPLLASSPYKDPRAPQNLIPISGLEGRLRRMLGDPRLLVRTLIAAAGTA
jgi:hypothetical protein